MPASECRKLSITTPKDTHRPLVGFQYIKKYIITLFSQHLWFSDEKISNFDQLRCFNKRITFFLFYLSTGVYYYHPQGHIVLFFSIY